jgi:hypothetical protein
VAVRATVARYMSFVLRWTSTTIKVDSVIGTSH